MTDPPSIPPEHQMTPPLLFYSAVSVIKNSVTTLSFACLFLFLLLVYSCFTQGFVNTADSEKRWTRVKKMAPDVWQVTLGVTNKSLKKLRGEIGDKAKLLKYNTAGIIIFSILETKLVFICLVRIKFSQ